MAENEQKPDEQNSEQTEGKEARATAATKDEQPAQAVRVSWLSIVLSTLAAAVGVQSDKNRQRDFQHTSIVPFVVAGVVFTVLFVLVLVLIVSWVVG